MTEELNSFNNSKKSEKKNEIITYIQRRERKKKKLDEIIKNFNLDFQNTINSPNKNLKKNQLKNIVKLKNELKVISAQLEQMIIVFEKKNDEKIFYRGIEYKRIIEFDKNKDMKERSDIQKKEIENRARRVIS